MPDQRVKKKKLRASEIARLLKIEGFAGFFETAPTEIKQSPAQKKEQDTPRPSASFKLKEAFQRSHLTEIPLQKKESSEQSVRVSGRDPFDTEAIARALDEYIAENKPEISVSVALKSHTPQLSGEKIVIGVDNPLQLEKAEASKPYIRHALMRKLNNGFIELEFRLCEEKEVREGRKLITGQDKLEFFIRQNPAVLELKKLFGLELD